MYTNIYVYKDIRNPNPKYENGGTWHWVTFEKLMIKIYDFFYSAKSFSHPE